MQLGTSTSNELESRFEALEMELDRHLDTCSSCGFELCDQAKELNVAMESVEDQLKEIGWEVGALANLTVRHGWD